MARLMLRNCTTIFLTKLELNTHTFCIAKFYEYAERPEKPVHDYPSHEYVDTSAQYKFGKKNVAKQLEQLFDLRPFTANELVSRYKALCSVNGKTICMNYDLLKEEGLEDKLILTYPDILARKNMEYKINLVKQLGYNVKDTAPLLNMDITKLSKLVKKLTMDHNRLHQMATLFQVPLVQACDFLVKRPFLQTMSMKKFETNLKLLIDFGIKMDDILNDFWVLGYGTHLISDKLQTAKRLNVDKLKTWMVRCKPEIFNTHLQRLSENKSILGENCVGDYLSQRLQCSSAQIKLILTKHPALLNKSLKKLNEIIDLLIDADYTLQHIVRSPKILLHSIETTKKRLKELESQEMKLDNLYILTKSQKQFMFYYDNLVKSKQKEGS